MGKIAVRLAPTCPASPARWPAHGGCARTGDTPGHEFRQAPRRAARYSHAPLCWQSGDGVAALCTRATRVSIARRPQLLYTSFRCNMPTWAVPISCARVSGPGRALRDVQCMVCSAWCMRGRGSGDVRSSVVKPWHWRASMRMQPEIEDCRWPPHLGQWAVPARAACSG